MQRRFVPVIALGIVGSVFAVYAYLSPDTGVTGTVGALLALVGAVCAMIGILVACFARLGGGLFGTLVFLIALASVLTGLAGYFLMQYGLAAVMAMTLVGLLVAVLLPKSQRRPI